MSNAQQQQAMAPVQRISLKIVRGPWADIAVYGWELVSPKLLEVIGVLLEALVDRDPGVRCIVFRNDNLPYGCLAKTGPDQGGVVVNLLEIFSKALNDTINEPFNSIWSAYHSMLIATLLHEFHHNDHISHEGWPKPAIRISGMSDEAWEAAQDAEMAQYDAIEKAANNWAFDNMIGLAKKGHDLECGPYHEDSFFCSQLKQMCDLDEDFLNDQTFMLENGLLFYQPEDKKHYELVYRRFKDICMIRDDLSDPSGTDWEDSGWGASTAPVVTESKVVTPEKITKEQMEGNMPIIAWVDQKAAEARAEATAEQIIEMNQPNTGYEDLAAEPAPTAPPTSAPVAPQTVVDEDEDMPEWLDEDESGMGIGYDPDLDGEVTPQQQPEVAAAAAPNAVAAQPVAQTLPDHGLSNEETQKIIFSVFNKIFDRIFSSKEMGGCGPLLNSNLPFINLDAAVQNAIQLTPEEQQVVVGYHGYDSNGQGPRKILTSETGGQIRGNVYKNARIPYFIIYINVGGVEYGRKLMPQNPNKQGNVNGFTRTALMARGGTRIMYTYESINPQQQGSLMWKRMDNNWLSPSQRI